MAYGIIYLVTNKINNLKYVGQTIRPLERRWEEHVQKALASTEKSKKQKYYFQAAIEKYGPENFSIEKIDEADSKEELDSKEEYWIEFYDTYHGEGYNLTPGGEGGYTRTVCKLSKSGELIQEYKSVAIAARENGLRIISSIIGCCKGEYIMAGDFQWCYKEDLLKRIGVKAKEKKQTNEEVLQYDLEGNFIKEWRSILEAETTLDIAHSKICAACREKCKTAGGFIWRYKDPNRSKITNEHIPKRRVRQYTKDEKLVKIWDTINEAALSIGQKKGGHISDVCKGKRPYCGGYIWRYDL